MASRRSPAFPLCLFCFLSCVSPSGVLSFLPGDRRFPRLSWCSLLSSHPPQTRGVTRSLWASSCGWPPPRPGQQQHTPGALDVPPPLTPTSEKAVSLRCLLAQNCTKPGIWGLPPPPGLYFFCLKNNIAFQYQNHVY